MLPSGWHLSLNSRMLICFSLFLLPPIGAISILLHFGFRPDSYSAPCWMNEEILVMYLSELGSGNMDVMLQSNHCFSFAPQFCYSERIVGSGTLMYDNPAGGNWCSWLIFTKTDTTNCKAMYQKMMSNTREISYFFH